MIVFFEEIFPWIIFAVSLILIIVLSKKRKKKSKNDDFKPMAMYIGMSIGIVIGIFFINVYGHTTLAYCMCLGMVLGTLVDLFLSKDKE